MAHNIAINWVVTFSDGASFFLEILIFIKVLVILVPKGQIILKWFLGHRFPPKNELKNLT